MGLTLNEADTCEHGTAGCPGRGEKHACVTERLPHPARIQHALVEASVETQRMITAAEKRGDADGAKAYGLLAKMIDIVMDRAHTVRGVQTWGPPRRET